MVQERKFINDKYKNSDPIINNEALNSVLDNGLDNTPFNIIFNNTIIDVPTSITYAGTDNEIREALNIIPNSGYITCEKLFKIYKKNLQQNGYSISLDNNLKFYFRFKLQRVFNNLSYAYNIERYNINLLSYVIPFNYDIEKNTYRAILEKKNSSGIYRNIQFSSYPLYPEFDYESGYIIFYQKDIETTNQLNINPNDEFYLSFIRYEGSFGAVITESGSESGTGSSANLINWSDASFTNVDISNLLSIYNNFNFSDLSDNNVANVSQIKELAENNFFFFFKSKPWPPVYLDGSYIIPYKYYYGTSNESIINNFRDPNQNNLKLKWKIPSRRSIIWNYNIDENIHYVPEYNNLIIEYRNNTNNIWNDLLSINMIDPSTNSGNINFSYINGSSGTSSIINNEYQDDFTFIFNLSRNIAVQNNTMSIDITNDNSFNINFTAGSTTIVNGLSYQFRVYLKNTSTFDITLTPDYKINQYNDINPLYNYLYYPDISSEYFETVSRGDPKPPTNLSFTPSYNNVTINGSINNTFADSNDIIAIPGGLTDDNQLGFILDLSASPITNYKKAIPFSPVDYYIDDISNLSNLSQSGSFSITIDENFPPNIQPEYNYDLSNYGMFFKDKPNDICYAILSSNPIATSFTTPHPLRNQVNLEYNNLINSSSINIFKSNLNEYNSNIDYREVTWRAGSNKSFNFFTDTSATFDISYSPDINLYNSSNYSSINQGDEPRGKELSGNNLSTFQLSTYKNTTLKHSSSPLQTIGTFDSSEISIYDISFTLTLNTKDISGPTSPYTTANGYYIGTTITDISYAIDLNNFFDKDTDLSDSNIIFKPQISQVFPNETPLDNSGEYPIYKITNDLTQEFIVETSNIGINVDPSTVNLRTYFGITSIRPTSAYTIEASFNADISGLSQYIRPTNIESIGEVTLEISAINISGGSLDTPSDRIDFGQNTKSNYRWPPYPEISMNLIFNLSINPYENFINDVYGNIQADISFQASYDLTLYNNVFTGYNISFLNVKSNIVELTENYFWDTTRFNQLDSSFSLTTLIKPTFSILSNFTESNLSEINHDSSINSIQAIFRNKFFYGPTTSNNIYIDYSIYFDNQYNYTDYSNTGTSIAVSYPIGTTWFDNTNEINETNNYKWTILRIDGGSQNKVKLYISGLEQYQAPNVLYYIKIFNPTNNLPNRNDTWFNCNQIYTGGVPSAPYQQQEQKLCFPTGRTIDTNIIYLPAKVQTYEYLYIAFAIKENFILNFENINYTFNN